MADPVNYDAIAPTYNRRFVDESRSGTLVALDELARDLHAERILEVGCGTGHWLEGLHGSPCQVYGLDFSAGMLKQAQERRVSLPLSQGRAEDLPFPAGAFDLVYCVNAIHHFERKIDFIRQAVRVLKLGGALAVIGMDPHYHQSDWYGYTYFPGTLQADLDRFPSWGQVLDWTAVAGFERMELRLAEQIVHPKHGSEVLNDPFLAKSSCSQLALLSDEAYQAGLSRIRQALAEAEARGEVLFFPDTIQIHIMTAWLPTI